MALARLYGISVYRSEKYRRWVASQPCIICGADDVQAAHIRTGFFGMGIKPDDSLCVPLCVKHHAEQHATTEAKFYRRSLDSHTLMDMVKAYAKEMHKVWEKLND